MADLRQSQVIDQILQDGTAIYNHHFPGQSRCLLASDLPSTVHIRGNAYQCTQSNIFSGLIDLDHSVEESLTFSLGDALTKAFLHCSSCLMTLGNGRDEMGFTTAVVKQNNKILSFDSHSRCRKRLKSASGTAVVMEASTVAAFVQYVRELANSLYSSTRYVPFEVVSLSVNCKQVASRLVEPNHEKVPSVESTSLQHRISAAKKQEQQKQSSSTQTIGGKNEECSVFCTVNTSGRRLVRCSICFKHPDVARMFSNKKKQLPALCSESGTVPRKELLEAHLVSEMHRQCVNMEVSEAVAQGVKDATASHQAKTVRAMFTAQQAQVGGKIVSSLYTVFNDAKRGTLSGWSWPSREVAHMFGTEKSSVLSTSAHVQGTPIVLSSSSLQYLVPSMHAELLACIVAADKKAVKDKVLNAMAVSVRADGSVDRTQIDNIHVMARIVTSDGECENVFLGFAEPDERGATGYTGAIRNAASFIVDWEDLFPKVTSIVTDGASINIGEKNGMWTQLQKSRDESPYKTVPLIKVWCAVHRSSLAWKSVCSNVPELQTLITDMTGIASYFRQSGIRTRELHALAKAMGLTVYSMPKYFDVRWAEFTYSLCRAIVGSWEAMVSYLKSGADGEAKPFLSKWTEYGRVKLLCFVSDVTYVFSRFQKSLQSDSLVLSDLPVELVDIVSKLRRMQTAPLLGGWESLFDSETTCNTADRNVSGQDEASDVAYLHGVELKMKTRRGQMNKYVSDRREYSAVRLEILESLRNFLEQRMYMPEVSALQVLKSLHVNVSDTELRDCHQTVCPDKDLRTFADEYRSAAHVVKSSLAKHVSDNTANKPGQLSLSSTFSLLMKLPGKFDVLKMSMARVIAAKPHSADVERLISYYNLLKTPDRSSLSPDVIKNNIHVRMNMTTLDLFDPIPSLNHWFSLRGRHDRTNQKAKEQEWFQGVFHEACRRSEEQCIDIDTQESDETEDDQNREMHF